MNWLRSLIRKPEQPRDREGRFVGPDRVGKAIAIARSMGRDDLVRKLEGVGG